MSRYPIALLSAVLSSYSTAFAQNQAVTQLPEVIVTADAPGQQTRQALETEQALTPGGVTLLDGDSFYERGVTNLSEMLRYTPGAWSAGNGSDAVFLSIRGSNLDAVDYDGSGVRILQDGLPVSAADGNNHNRFPDPLNARNVIVARGANALTYGASTLGGAIDFISPTARGSAPFEAFITGGSHGLLQGRLAAGKVAGDFDVHAAIEARRWDGYRDHSRQERESLYANLGWQFNDKLRTRFYYSRINNEDELPGALTRSQWRDDPEQANPANVPGNFQLNVQTWRLANKTTWDIDAESSVTFGLSYEEQDLYHPIVETPFFSLLIDTEQRNAGTTLRYKLRAGQHDLLAGIDYAETRVKGGNFGSSGGFPTFQYVGVENKAENLNVYAMDRWRFAPRWTAVYGAQATAGSRKTRTINPATGATADSLQEDYDSINPRVGLIHHLTPDTELFTNLSRVYEAPTLYQLVDQTTGTGQPLDAMRGAVVEIGARGKDKLGKGRWHWDLAAYYTALRDEILSIDNPATPGQGNSLSVNVDKTIHAGIEALVGASLPLDAKGAHRIEPLINFTLNHFRFDNDTTYGDNRLPGAPRYALKGEVLYRHAAGFFIGPTFDWVGKRYADFSNTYEVDSYALWGLRAGYIAADWELFAEVRNMADKEYIARNGVQALAPADAAVLYPGEPRTVYLGMRTRF